MRPPLVWFGGKGQTTPKLLKYVPEHTFYAEVFGGGGSLLFAKEPSPYEVYNDIDSGVVNFFRVLRDKDKFEEFYRLVNLTPFSREEFFNFVDTLDDSKDEIVRAYKFFIINRWSFSGNFGKSIGIAKTLLRRNTAAHISKWLSIVDMLPEFVIRLKNVTIENEDFRYIFKYYISKWEYNNSFVYLDPPYLQEVRSSGGYKFETSDKDHLDLLDLILEYTNNSKFMLSGYDNEIYNDKLKDWNKICFDVALRAAKATKNTKMYRREECLWMNY